MFKKLIWGGLLGGIILFAWGAISWMVLPWHMKTLHGFTDEASVVQVIKTNATQSGIYFLPLKESEHAQSTGPLVFASINQEGMPSMTPSLIRGFLSSVIAALLVTWMLLQTTGRLNYFGRVIFVIVFACAGSILTHFTYWNWFYFASDFTLVEIADALIAWLLAGLVLAKIASPKMSS